MFCSLCAADNPNDGRFCVKCGAVLQGQRGMAPPAPGFDAPAARYTGPTETSGKAIASSLVLDKRQHLADGVPRQPQTASNLPDRFAGSPATDNFIALGFGHDFAILR